MLECADVVGIAKVLSLAPVLNDGTKFTSVMSAQTGLYNTIVRVPNAGPSNPTEDVKKALRFFVRNLAQIEGL